MWLDATIKAHNFIEESYWKDSYNIVKEQYIPISDTYVFWEDGVIKGFVAIIEENFIGAIFVDIASQGKSIGKQLVAHVKEIYDVLELSVYKDNVKSYEFYKKVGFEVISEQQNEIIATVECRISKSSKNIANIGMTTSDKYRKKGIATYVVNHIRKEANKKGFNVICSTSAENIGAQKSIERAGMKLYHTMYKIKV